MKSLLFLLCDYDLENFDKNKNPQFISMTDENKLQKFCKSMNNLFFSDAELNKQIDLETLKIIWN